MQAENLIFLHISDRLHSRSKSENILDFLSLKLDEFQDCKAKSGVGRKA